LQNYKSSGVLIKMASPAPWISDPTATDARGRGGPRRAPGAQVHGGPPRLKRRGTRSWPFVRDRTAQEACKRGRRRRRRREAAHGGSSPALALDGAPGHLSDHGLEQNVEGAHVHVTKGSRGAIVPHRRPAPKGGARGCSGDLVEALLCVKGREIGQGLLLTVKR
jgi:hypothetical protein